MSQIVCHDLCLGYEGREILHCVNFTVSAGDYLCVVGENGAGKSTLLRTLLGLQPPMSGTVTFGDGLTRESIGYLPQQTVVQRDFPATVREIVLSGCQGSRGWHPFYTAQDKEKALSAMERLGITPLRDRCYRELSGGQQQRVLLARALCATKSLLLLDEPVAGLDPKVTADLYDLIDGLHRDGITVVMISHDLAAVLTRATHILHIGKEIFFGEREAYLASDVGRRFTASEGGKGASV